MVGLWAQKQRCCRKARNTRRRWLAKDDEVVQAFAGADPIGRSARPFDGGGHPMARRRCLTNERKTSSRSRIQLS
jgi:hypothetical protein